MVGWKNCPGISLVVEAKWTAIPSARTAEQAEYYFCSLTAVAVQQDDADVLLPIVLSVIIGRIKARLCQGRSKT